MTNLHDKRFTRKTDTKSDWKFVAVPNQFRPTEIRASVDTVGYHVQLVARAPSPSSQAGVPPKFEVVRFRGNSPEELKECILDVYPNAVFTTGNPEPNDLKFQYEKEMKQQKERLARAAEQKQFEQDVTSEHRKIAAGLTRREQLRATYGNLNSFATDETFGGTSWVEWFRQHPAFLSYPNNSYENRDILIKFCESKGQFVPLAGEIADAMLYLLQHKHFYMQPSYKRSEVDTKEAVQPFVREITPAEQITDDDIREVVKRLTAKFGLPVTVSLERLQAVGIHPAQIQAVFDKLQQLYSPEPVEEKSTEELKVGLQAMRNAARGNKPRARQENLSGY